MLNKQWDDLNKHYRNQDWINKPNIFAEEVLKYFPKSGRILCLGDGQGQDARFFASKGYKVTSTDISDEALNINKEKTMKSKNIIIEKLDLRKRFPYMDVTFDIVYAHLAVQFFSEEVTKSIFKEIKRVLKKGGILAVFVNSVNDPQFNTGRRIEQEFFEIGDKTKRFFSKYSMLYFTSEFETILVDDNGRTYKDEAKGVHNLVRYVGKK